jgi:hypothetical protein
MKFTMKQKFIFIVAIIIAIAFFLSSCEKKKDITPEKTEYTIRVIGTPVFYIWKNNESPVSHRGEITVTYVTGDILHVKGNGTESYQFGTHSTNTYADLQLSLYVNEVLIDYVSNRQHYTYQKKLD